jgi:indole-3-glycerol phosphate synthase
LRKDFIVDEYQVYQSKFYGADAILLIGKALSISNLKSLLKLSEKLGLDVLYEIHDHEDLVKGIEAGVKIFGVNNRDLETFDVDNTNVLNFLNLIPEDSILVSESGIGSKKDLDTLNNKGINNFLIGEFLMTSNDRISKIKELLE